MPSPLIPISGGLSPDASGERFHLGDFLSRWHGRVRHDLSASHSQTLSLGELLALATDDELAQWTGQRLEYATPWGATPLRALIAARHSGLDVDDIVCCAGAQEAMACVARALLSPGDHAVMVLPIYQPLERTVTDRARATGIPLQPDLTLDLDRMAAAIRPETRLVVTNFPNSPTGATLPATSQAALVDLCRAHGVWLINDEVYRQTAADPKRQAPSVVDVYERGISINSLSKGFGLPGLRVGWVACRDRALAGRIVMAKAALSSCVSVPTELLAQIALREEQAVTARARAIGLANRNSLDRVLERHAGLLSTPLRENLAFASPEYQGPDGAEAFAERLASATGVLVMPGRVWQSPLAHVPDRWLRIGLGAVAAEAGISAIGDYLDRCHSSQAAGT